MSNTQPVANAMPTWSWIIKPTAKELEAEFDKFRLPEPKGGRMPCSRTGDRKVRNQCAVRMSVALSRAMGIDVLESYKGGNVHSSRCCKGEHGTRHITGATDLLNHLRDALHFKFEKCFINDPATVNQQKGIIFFTKCFSKHDGTIGSHIDYWDGEKYSNKASGSGAANEKLKLFGTSIGDILFCKLI
ncbi:MAG: hypothetical protein ACI835_003388 [Planctomycetota bacterium]|jgi:hypothetical protein